MSRIIALHSSLSSSGQWRALSRKAKAYQMTAADLLGYGQNPLVRSYPEQLHTLDAEIDALLPILESAQSYHLVGHSFGGAISIKIAHRFPQKVRSLTLFEPVAFYLFEQEHSIQRQVNVEFKEFKQQTLERPRAAAQHFIDFWNGVGTFAALPETTATTFTKQILKVQMDFEAITHDPLKLEQLDFNFPVHVLYGEASRPLTIELAQTLGQHTKAQISPIAGGHMAPLNSASEVSRVMLEFIQNHI